VAVRLLAALLIVVGLTGACTPPGLPPPQAPESTTAAPTSATASKTITVGIDGSVGGFNPYVLQNFSSAARAVASLVLPSVSTVDAAGASVFDNRLVSSATVTGRDPFTVTYQLVRAATWSDGTPVTAEDFQYLQQQMLTAVGTSQSAAYRAVTSIRSLDAGKKVQVAFSSPVRDWPTMFSPLLPAHILKDAPGGFATGLAGGIPVSAGPYRLESVDRVTGLISLVRNDKYWGRQPGPASVVLRIGTAGELVGALERGDVQALLFQPGNSADERLQATVPNDRRVLVPVPASIQLVFNQRSGPTTSLAVRTAVAQALSPEVLDDALTGSRASGTREVFSMVRLPAQPPVADPAAGPAVPMGDADAAEAALRAAGYDTSGLYATRDGVPLRISVGFPSGDQRSANAARAVQSQLGGVGIEVDLLVDTTANVAGRLTSGELGMALLTVPRGRSDAVTAASSFGCGLPDTPGSGNLSGYCTAGTESALAAALAGRGGLAAVDRQLAADIPVIPLGEPVAVFAVSAGLARVAGRAGRGWLWTGPLAGLPDWPSI
jgi:ABC-type transport system substrate-binding protein